MRQPFNLRLISLIVLVGMSMFLFSIGSSAAIQYVTTGQHILPENTVVASIDLSGKSREEAIQQISERTDEWKENSELVVNLDGKSLKINPEVIQFNVKASIEQVLETGHADLIVELDESYIPELKNHMGEQLAGEFSEQRFIETLKNDARQLPDHALEYNAYTFVKTDADSLYKEIGGFTLEVPEGVDMERVIEIFNDSVVPQGRTFSYLEFLNEEGVYDETSLNVLASSVYGASLKAGLIIQERHISHRLPAYAQIGLEATVELKKHQDLKVYNPFSNEYKLSVDVEGSKLTVKWLGYPTNSDFHLKFSDVEKISPKTIIQYSSLVTEGPYNLLQEGEDGEVVSVFRLDRSSQEGVEEFISEDYYPPEPRVEEHSSITDEGSVQGGANDSDNPYEGNPSGPGSNGEADSSGSENGESPDARNGSAKENVWEEVPESETK
ncbi:VanW family protein [Halobacillus sp. H74]|uniref:VanW family protein n=1 Tax=Halobacillus sp. H74 TaxID=3457436 RepID=UPI003FCE1F8E